MSVRGSNEWTDDDMLLALRLRDAGRSYDQIARRLGRSTMATRVMINKIARDLAQSEAA